MRHKPIIYDHTICEKYVTEAIELPDGTFNAVFGMPGGTPIFVTKEGEKRVYKHKMAAIGSAALAIVNSKNNRPRNKMREKYGVFSGEEFSVALSDAKITPTFFAYLAGVTMDQANKWSDAEKPEDCAPHSIRVLLEIFFESKEMVEVAKELAEDVIEDNQ